MSSEKEKQNIQELLPSTPTVEIKPHPDEILELDELTVAVGKAKLAGIDFTEIYGDEDRVSSKLMIRQQAQKIRELFGSPSKLELAFSSPGKVEETKRDLLIDGIDLEYVKSYCKKRQIGFKDDAQALCIVGFDGVFLGDTDV